MFLLSFAAAQISLDNQLDEVYNIQDLVKIPVTIVAGEEINDVLTFNLECGTAKKEIYKEFIFMIQGDMKTREIFLPLIKDFIGDLKGNCSVVHYLGNESETLANFKISELIEVGISGEGDEFVPGEIVSLRVHAIKENGESVNGTLFAKLDLEDEVEVEEDIEEDGSIKINIPFGLAAGSEMIKVRVEEYDSIGHIINHGEKDFVIEISQVPTNLEIVIEEKDVMPGTNFRAKLILHDQTGEKIEEQGVVIFRNYLNEIEERLDVNTDEFFEISVKNNEDPLPWTIEGNVKNLTEVAVFNILINMAVEAEIINNTVILTNVGNVFYNESVIVTVGNQNLELKTNLKIDESLRYELKAPKGEYNIKIGDLEQTVFLTGKSISVKKARDGESSTLNYSWIWIIIILVLVLVAVVIFRRSHNGSFFGKIGKRKKSRNKDNISVKEMKIVSKKGINTLISPANVAELSLSIVGSKQDATILTIHLKNYDEIKTGEGNTKETLEKIINAVESEKGYVYENKGTLFFIFAPIKTKTFQNEMNALHLADKMKKYLEHHNKMFKQKIDYGLALNYGTVITKDHGAVMKFMSMGTLMTEAKKISMHSNGEICLGTKVRERVKSEIKTDIKQLGNISAHVLKEIVDKANHSTFIKGFVARQKKEMALQKDKK